jgi:SAM-dependent methyltransferase
VSGSADYGMLAHVSHAFAERPLDVTVIDRCPTSIWLNQWYAERYALPVTTACADALEFESDTPFDVITTHNFVGRFDRETRQRLVERWRDLLRPGGVVVTTQRVRPGSRAELARYAPDEAREVAERVTRAAAAFAGPALGAAPSAIGDCAYEYALRKGGYVIASPRDVVELFERSGFDVNLADEGGQAERDSDRPSSTAGKDTYRMRLVATKR